MFLIAPGQITVDSVASGKMVAVIGVIQAEALQGSEVSLDGIEPTGIGWCPDLTNIVFLGILFQSVMAVR